MLEELTMLCHQHYSWSRTVRLRHDVGTLYLFILHPLECCCNLTAPSDRSYVFAEYSLYLMQFIRARSI